MFRTQNVITIQNLQPVSFLINHIVILGTNESLKTANYFLHIRFSLSRCSFPICIYGDNSFFSSPFRLTVTNKRRDVFENTAECNQLL
jgi:hypothetical protein